MSNGHNSEPGGSDRDLRAWTADKRRDGTDQPSRFPIALSDGYFDVDEMRLEHLIALTARFARNIKFFNLKNEAVGSWSDLYARDPAFVLAEISWLEAAQLGREIRRIEVSDGPASVARCILHLARRMDYWHRTLRRSDDPAAAGMSWEIEQIAKHELQTHLADVRGLTQEDGEPATTGGLWQSGPSTAEAEEASLKPATHAFLGAISHLRPYASQFLRENLRNQRHDPAVGLSIAFLELFERAQRKLNEFTGRRLDFYYNELLRIKPRELLPDSAHLVLRPLAGVDQLLIDKGTEFSAGTDEDANDMVFVADSDVYVTDARVESVRSVEYDNALAPSGEMRDYVTDVRASRIDREGFEGIPADDATLFDETRTGEAGFRDRDGRIGFAVTSPILTLKEGIRTLKFEIGLAAPTDPTKAEVATRALRSLIPAPARTSRDWKAFFPALHRHESMGARAERGTAAPAATARARALFHKVFRRCLSVRLSGENGWIDVDDVYVGPTDDWMGLRLAFTLGPEVDPVVPHSPELHGGGYETAHPVASFQPNASALHKPYSLFRALELVSISVEAHVEGASDLFAYNHLGGLDPTKPFHPFGPLPSRDSYMVIGSYEAARKDLIAADLHIEWAELPQDRSGWRQYYNGYETEFDNESFVVDVSTLRDNQWHPLKEERPRRERLFDTEEDSARIKGTRIMPLGAIQFFQPVLPSLSQEDFQSPSKTRSGLIRLSLAPSPDAFGHKEYPHLLMQTLANNAKRRRQEPIPNPPYTPLIQRMSLDYRARCTMWVGVGRGAARSHHDERVLHLHPFGFQDLTPRAEERFTLLPGGPSIPPKLEQDAPRGAARLALRESGSGGEEPPSPYADGYLFIGLLAEELTGPLSLLIHVLQDRTDPSPSGGRDSVWFYLASNRWRALDRSRVLKDTARDFQQPGIVTLDIPGDIDRRNTILDPDYYWIAVAPRRGIRSLLERLIAVRAGAIKATWENRDNIRPRIKTGLPAGSIEGPLKPVVGLRSVEQIGPTFGGRPAEDPKRVRTRVSERLRHRQRATTPWDYERLLLERFPDIYKAKCFPNTSAREYCEGRSTPGSVMIAVLPRPRTTTTEPDFSPMLSGVELEEIHDYLTKMSSNCATIEVRNPAYERVQVRCTVTFVRGAASGHFRKQVGDALREFISPWGKEGRGGRFGWVLRHHDVERFIRALPFVEFVTNLSMLHISRDEAAPRFSLGDTARKTIRQTSEEKLEGRYPWSLAIPTRRQAIAVRDEAIPSEATPTGIGELEIGSTLIIGPAT